MADDTLPAAIKAQRLRAVLRWAFLRVCSHKNKTRPATVTPTTLPSLPGEVIDNIADHLDTKDVKNLRRTCLALSAKAKWSFRRAFHTIALDLSPSGFARLQSIADDEVLRHGVKKMVAEKFKNKGWLGVEKTIQLYLVYMDLNELEDFCIPVKQAVALRYMLEYRFIHCKHFAVLPLPRRTHGTRDSTLGRAEVPYIIEFLSLAMGPGVNARSLDFAVQKCRSPHTYDVATALWGTLNFRNAWASLTTMKLQYASGGVCGESRSFARLTIQNARNLRSLTLDLPDKGDFDSPRSANKLLQRLLHSRRLPRLEELAIHRADRVNHQVLSSFLLRFKKTLVKLHLEDVVVTYETLPENATPEYRRTCAPWNTVLAALAQADFAKLESFALINPREMMQPDTFDLLANWVLFFPLGPVRAGWRTPRDTCDLLNMTEFGTSGAMFEGAPEGLGTAIDVMIKLSMRVEVTGGVLAGPEFASHLRLAEYPEGVANFSTSYMLAVKMDEEEESTGLFLSSLKGCGRRLKRALQRMVANEGE